MKTLEDEQEVLRLYKNIFGVKRKKNQRKLKPTLEHLLKSEKNTRNPSSLVPQNRKIPRSIRSNTKVSKWDEWKQLQPDYCCVCLIDQAGPEDLLIFCENEDCEVCVHQSCYGITSLPAKNIPWFCDPCRLNERVLCALCPFEGGAMKKAENGTWCHVVCVVWNGEITLDNTEAIAGIRLETMPSRRWNQECSICSQNNTVAFLGVCVQCDAGMCKNYMHVTCAQKWSLMECVNGDEMNDDAQLINDPYFIFCKVHAPVNPKIHPWFAWFARRPILKFKLENCGYCDLQEECSLQMYLERYQTFYKALMRDLVTEKSCIFKTEKMTSEMILELERLNSVAQSLRMNLKATKHQNQILDNQLGKLCIDLLNLFRSKYPENRHLLQKDTILDFALQTIGQT